MKKYNETYNVGRSKYIINYHDGSEFYGIAIFSNKRKFNTYKKNLIKKYGY